MSTVRIPLTQGKSALIDEEDFERVSGHKWHAARNGNVWYAWATINDRAISMHRFLMGKPAGSLVDHINHDGLDNRRGNLRTCTQSQNQCNRMGPPAHSTTGFVGVRKCRASFHAHIKVNGTKIHLGAFATPEDAARVRDEAAKRLHGEFAFLNFPDLDAA